MPDVTFVNDNTGDNVVQDTDEILVVKVLEDKARVKALDNNYFITLASYTTNKATLVSEGVEILD